MAIEDQPRCGAKLRNKDATCQAIAMANGRCRIHGGKSPRGIESPHFKSGKYSRYLAGDLLERYQQSRDDPELTSVRDEIALLDARLQQLLGRVQDGAVEEAWIAVNDVTRRLGYIADHPDMEDREEALERAVDTLETAVTTTHEDRRQWLEITTTAQHRRRMADTERKREELLTGTLLNTQALSLMTALLAAVHEVVPDTLSDPVLHTDGRKIKAAIGEAVGRLMGRPARPALPAGEGQVQSEEIVVDG